MWHSATGTLLAVPTLFSVLVAAQAPGWQLHKDGEVLGQTREALRRLQASDPVEGVQDAYGYREGRLVTFGCGRKYTLAMQHGRSIVGDQCVAVFQEELEQVRWGEDVRDKRPGGPRDPFDDHRPRPGDGYSYGYRCCSNATESGGARSVSCLSEVASSMDDNGYRCPAPGLYARAAKTCAERGWHVCSVEELRSDVCCNKGCGHDRQMVWSRDPCQLPPEEWAAAAAHRFGPILGGHIVQRLTTTSDAAREQAEASIAEHFRESAAAAALIAQASSAVPGFLMSPTCFRSVPKLDVEDTICAPAEMSENLTSALATLHHDTEPLRALPKLHVSCCSDAAAFCRSEVVTGDAAAIAIDETGIDPSGMRDDEGHEQLAPSSTSAHPRFCSGRLTHHHAEQFCAQMEHLGRPMRLCRPAELRSDVCCNQGCGYSRVATWTDESCELSVHKAVDLIHSPLDLDHYFDKYHRVNYTKRAYFLHVPKAGGTSATAVLRRILCALNGGSSEVDCCRPGSCDARARPCRALMGCNGHMPLLRQLTDPKKQFHFATTVIRHPVQRTLSGFFYRCHNPNEDCFTVKAEFCPVSRHNECTRKGYKDATFEEYVAMPEYSNILTRMLGPGRFPYGSPKIEEEHFQLAMKHVDYFDLVGFQEASACTVLALNYIAGTEPWPEDFRHLRSHPLSYNHQRDPAAKKRLAGVLKDTSSDLYRLVASQNNYDLQLYRQARQRFCAQVRAMAQSVGAAFWRTDLVDDAELEFDNFCTSAD